MHITYSPKEIVKATGASTTTLLQWVERGIVVPETPHPGRGQVRRWSFRDAVMVRALVQLTHMGVTARLASQAAEMIAEEAERMEGLSAASRKSRLQQSDQPIYFWRDVDGHWKSSVQLGLAYPPELPAIVIVPSQIVEQIKSACPKGYEHKQVPSGEPFHSQILAE